ncbi:hypothetical protein BDN71DRAFT_1511120 [Pleurotus eryngii]|uniref:Uncharacterized protein n=1 Tax=Pleurotus eryngii TaxID=5323 RepID=A0A9P5ZN99_PLEER|nr:hypothetical protein BDN71DRAFT_1511120 [Pleurotus eryngii]
MSAIIAYDISSQQAVTATFTELQQQLLAQEMYAFAKRASNRKFKQEIEAKWLITRTLSTLKEKTDELIREFFDNPHTKTACAVAEAAQELRKQQQLEGRKKGEQVAEAEDAMEVDGTGPSGVPKAAAPKEKVPTAPKRRNVEVHEGRKVVRGHGGVQSKLRGPRRSPTVDEGAGKATDEITVRKIVAPKKRATAKSKSMIGSETNEVGEGGRPVAGPSKPCRRPEPSSDEGEEFPELSNDDEESESDKRRNPRRQVKPRKGSMALPKVKIVERNMHGTTHLLSLGPTNDSLDQGLKLVLDMLGRNGLADVEGSVEQRSEPAYQAAGSTYKRTLVGEWAQRHSNTPIAPIVAEPAEPAPPAPASLPPLLPDMPPPPPTVAPPCTPLLAPHQPLSPSQGPTSPSTPPPHSLSPTHSPSLAHDLPTAPLPPAPL